MPLYNCIMTHIMKQQYPSPSNNINLERTSKGIMYTLNAICSRKNPAPLFFSDSYLLPQPIQRPTCNSQTNEKHKGLSQQYSALLLYIYIYIYIVKPIKKQITVHVAWLVSSEAILKPLLRVVSRVSGAPSRL